MRKKMRLTGRKNILKFLIMGISFGVVSGLIQALRLISFHRYFHYRMDRLILYNLTARVNEGLIFALLISILLILFISVFTYIWRKLFSPIFEIRIILKSNPVSLIAGLISGLIFTYLIIHIIRYVQNPFQLKSFLGNAFLVICLLLLSSWLGKRNPQSLQSTFSNFLKSRVVKISLIVVLSVPILLNAVTLSQKILIQPSGPNVLLIVVDTLRADHLGCYGYGRPTSPNIDHFAANALVFEKTLSNSPWTKPSMGSLFTSLHPHEHKAFYWEHNLENSNLSLAEVFRDSNYKTFAVQTNPLLTKRYNFHQGFQSFTEIINERAEKVTSVFHSWLKKNRNRPFFAYLHFMDVHLPYDAPEEFKKIFEPERIDSILDESMKGAYEVRILTKIGLTEQDKHHFINLYDAEIRYFDHYFGIILDKLENMDLLEETIIVLTSDHGEEFWEHDGFEHGHSLYTEVIHVPLIINHSSKYQGQRVKSCVPLLDLFPTILSLSELKKNFKAIGSSQISYLTKDTPRKEPIYFEGIGFGAEKKGVLKEGWKLIENTGIKSPDALELYDNLTKYFSPEYKKGYELYDTNSDFSERHNVIELYPKIAKRLKVFLDLFKVKAFDLRKPIKTDLEKKREDLKSLGYIK